MRSKDLKFLLIVVLSLLFPGSSLLLGPDVSFLLPGCAFAFRQYAVRCLLLFGPFAVLRLASADATRNKVQQTVPSVFGRNNCGVSIWHSD